MEVESNIQNGTKLRGSADNKLPVSYVLDARINVEKSETYVLDLALNDKESCSTFAVALSNHIIKLFSIEKRINISTLKGHEKTINEIRYSRENSNLLYSSSQDGTIRLWDTRQKGDPVRIFTDTSDGAPKPIISFDLSLDEQFICGGTETIREDSFLIFWDSRTSSNLGGYWNSHTDDITQVRYHPSKNCVMASASVDGLVNIFDLSQDSEDDSLLTTLNTGSSVGKVMWQTVAGDEDKFICLTHNEEVQAWKVDQANPYLCMDRDSLKNCGNNSTDVNYLIDTLESKEQAFVVSGNRNGKLHIWSLNETSANLWAQIDNAHKEDARSIAWNQQDKTLFTGGEDGTVCIWKTAASENLKIPTGKKKKRLSKPY